MFRRISDGKVIIIVVAMVAGFCLLRSVSASERVEVYSATESGTKDSDENSDESDDSNSDEMQIKADIRLSRPEEAEERLADEGQPQVKGVERLGNKDSMGVPLKRGRSIASDPAPTQDTTPATKPLPLYGNPYPSTATQSVFPTPKQESVTSSVDSPIPESTQKSRRGIQEVSLIVSDYGFFPNQIFVNQNVPVKIFLSTPSKNTMCFMLDQWGVKKGITPGKVEEVSFMPTTPGDFKIHCPIKSIQGVLTVKETPILEPSRRGLATSDDLKAEVMDIVVFPDARKNNQPKNAEALRGVIEE